MTKVIGAYRIIQDTPVLIIDLDKATFERLKKHIADNMFFAFRRVAAGFKKILLSSIGDHLDSNDNQNLNKADIAIEATIEESIPTTIIDGLNSSNSWFVCARHKNFNLAFSIDKETQYIRDRAFQNNE